MHALRSRIPTSTKRKLRRVRDDARRAIRSPVRQRRFRAALGEVVALAPAVPPRSTLERLVDGWDNPAAGDVEYLEKVIELCHGADGPVLECGSGLTTLLLAAHSPHPVWTLEADERWFRRVVGAADDAGLDHSHLLHAPLEDHGAFYWYRLPPAFPEQFSLVVCDGPAAGGLKGGRVGLMPVVGDRIASGAAIVVDRGMVYEHDAVSVWEQEHGLVIEEDAPGFRVYRTP